MVQRTMQANRPIPPVAAIWAPVKDNPTSVGSNKASVNQGPQGQSTLQSSSQPLCRQVHSARMRKHARTENRTDLQLADKVTRKSPGVHLAVQGPHVDSEMTLMDCR